MGDNFKVNLDYLHSETSLGYMRPGLNFSPFPIKKKRWWRAAFLAYIMQASAQSQLPYVFVVGGESTSWSECVVNSNSLPGGQDAKRVTDQGPTIRSNIHSHSLEGLTGSHL